MFNVRKFIIIEKKEKKIQILNKTRIFCSVLCLTYRVTLVISYKTV